MSRLINILVLEDETLRAQVEPESVAGFERDVYNKGGHHFATGTLVRIQHHPGLAAAMILVRGQSIPLQARYPEKDWAVVIGI